MSAGTAFPPLHTLKKGSNMPVPIIDDSVVSGITKFLEALNSSGSLPKTRVRS